MHLPLYLLLLYLFTPYTAHSEQQATTFSETEPIPGKEHDLFQQCATDICGPANRDLFGPDNQYSNFLMDNESFDKTVTVDPEISSKFNRNIQSTIIETIQNLKRILNTLKNTLQDLNSRKHTSEWDRIGKEIALYYMIDTEEDNLFFKRVESKSRWSFLINKLKKSKASLEQIAPFCSEAICRKMVRDELLHLQSTLEQSIQPAENNMNQYLKYCESVYAVTITQDQQIKTYKENLEEYKGKFLNTVFVDYSMESQEQFADYINNGITIRTHGTDGEQRFINIINNTNTATKKSSSQKFSFTNVMNSLPKNTSVCPSHIIMGRFYSSNNFIKGKDKILTGFKNYFFPEHGKQIFAHELAHALSEQFTKGRLSQSSYKQYRKLRNCATRRFKFDNSDSSAREIYFATREGQIFYPYHENDKLSTEEDAADLIAYKVFQNEPTIALCLLIGPSERGGTEYGNLRMINHGDTYSPSFLRIIMEVIHKRIELSESCQQVVDIYSDRINFEPCF